MSFSPEDFSALSGMYDNAGALQQKQIEQQYKLGKADIAGRYKVAQLQSGDNRAQIEATREYQRGQLAQAAAEMERVNIPRVQIEQYVAQKNYEIAQGELQVKRDTLAQQAAQYEKDYGLKQGELTGQFNGQDTLAMQQFKAAQVDLANKFGISQAELTGQYQGSPTLAMQQFQAAQAQLARQFGLDESAVTGMYNGQQTAAEAERQRQFGLSQAGVTGYYNGQQTADEAERQRRYQLDVAKYGTDLASQADRYFQAKRFAALDAPRLLGQSTAGAQVGGSPTPQIQTMGAALSGQGQGDASPYGGPSAGADQAQSADERYKQIAQIAKASPPSPYDGLSDQDRSTLRLMQNVYEKGGNQIPGGELDRLGDAQKGFLKSAGSLLGYDYQDLENSYKQYRPAQGSASLAG